ncbi:MAG: hypothetical protein E3K32_06565 [wastewater metagenome]|nr:hypothetical protein [Candidatus Loosdrechtia aerotolerans]
MHYLSRGVLLIFLFVFYILTVHIPIVFARESESPKGPAPVEVVAQVDKEEVTIGDRIQLNVRVKYKGDTTVQFPELDKQFGVFTVKETKIVEGPKQGSDGYSIIGRDYILSSYEIGSATIPSLKISYKGTQGEGEATTNEIIVNIKGVMKEGETVSDIKDIFPPVDVPASYKRLFQWILTGLGVLLLAGIVYGVLYKIRRRQKEPIPVLIKRPPHEVAYELLEGLLREGLVDKGLIKEYYYRITDILRRYIEEQFGLLAPERTTEEFLVEMVHTNRLGDDHKLLIKEFLIHCDMVKYAKYGPSKGEVQETYTIAKRLIDETRERLKRDEFFT